MEEKKKRFVELVKESPISTDKFINHCLGVCEILEQKNCTEEVCLAGLYHSIYGTSYFNVTNQTVENDRDLIKKEIGEYAESLVYEMCILSDRETDILSGRINYETKFFTDIVCICLANLLELQCSDGNNSDLEKGIFQYEILLGKLLKGINPFQIQNTIENDIKVFDDYIPTNVKHHLWNFVIESNFQYGHRSGVFHLKEPSLRFSCYLNREDVFNTWLYPTFQRIAKELEQDIFLGGYYIGNYNRGTCAEAHTDTCINDCLTILVYPNLKWDESWGGDIKFYVEGSPFNKCIDFVPGRIIAFDSKLEHKVMPLSSTCESNRFSFAFKACTHKSLHKFITHYSLSSIIHVPST